MSATLPTKKTEGRKIKMWGCWQGKLKYWLKIPWQSREAARCVVPGDTIWEGRQVAAGKGVFKRYHEH